MSGALAGLVLGVFGPTASGKSAIAEALAARTPATLVAADSMQLYDGLPILSNQPETPTELVGIWPLAHEASVAEYAALAHAAIDRACAAGRTPILVGGTGLYFRAAVVDLAVPPAPLPGARQRLEQLYDEHGPDGAHAELAARDPAAAAAVHPNDRRRVVRALELAEAGGSLRPAEDRLWQGAPRRPTLAIGLVVDPEELARRIEARTREMLARGAADEARRAVAGPLSRTASQAIGLRELTSYDVPDPLDAIVVRTRRYAAYQRKWMRRIPDLVTVDANHPPDAVADAILEVARARERLPGRGAS